MKNLRVTLSGEGLFCLNLAIPMGALFIPRLVVLSLLTLTISGNCSQPGLQPGHGNWKKIDPCLGLDWRVATDSVRTGGPGKLVLYGKVRALPSVNAHAAKLEADPSTTVIHVGDWVRVEQDTSSLHASFRALALQSASPGQSLRVRLMTAAHPHMAALGPTIRARAVSVGYASWLSVERGK